MNLYNEIELKEVDAKPYQTDIDDISIITKIVRYPQTGTWQSGKIEVKVSNRNTSSIFAGLLQLRSTYFTANEVDCEIERSSSVKKIFELRWVNNPNITDLKKFDFEIELAELAVLTITSKSCA